MKKRSSILSLLVALIGLSIALPALAARPWMDDEPVEVELVDDQGRSLRQFPIYEQSSNTVSRAYVEARQDENYSIRVRNNTSQRIGLVIAVDGRNIVSGKKSRLSRNERMYVLRPHATQVYDGWRSSKNKIHRFFFTDSADSYAEETFGDHSAMGVIAVAAYAERRHQARPEIAQSPQISRSKRSGQSYGMQDSAAEPGTGFGDSEWSPSVRVEFEAQNQPIAKHFLKYEWRETLCRKGIVHCRRPEPRNRFWPEDNWDDGYAPYPPGRGPWRY